MNHPANTVPIQTWEVAISKLRPRPDNELKMKNFESEHFCKMIEENKYDSSRMWKCLKDALPQSANHSVSVIKSGKKVLSKPVQVAEVFNKHFTTHRPENRKGLW